MAEQKKCKKTPFHHLIMEDGTQIAVDIWYPAELAAGWGSDATLLFRPWRFADGHGA